MNILRILFSIILVRPLVQVLLGLKVRHRERLPRKGPAIIVANHNSHLDTLVLTSLFPLSMLRHLRPVAAADYFLRNRFVSWFSLGIMNILPIQRKGRSRKEDLFTNIYDALAQQDIVILFPEGTRGEPEVLQRNKTGLYHLTKHCPDVPIYPVFLHGLGKTLPKGDYVLIPFFCDVLVGEPFYYQDDRGKFMAQLDHRIVELAKEGDFQPWD
ncbi:lysophospholipid acyltransferase family protein [Risungbinella massiliensis]|uniref:lysophospholipid acyltransferase family protein n=1 Tax=Risungbinella massiliensis TaxID=1329796 RepID=UPI0005CC0AF3|nr:lysophospholipid acyltransferase family protein [Risungbinella massiliensis]